MVAALEDETHAAARQRHQLPRQGREGGGADVALAQRVVPVFVWLFAVRPVVVVVLLLLLVAVAVVALITATALRLKNLLTHPR